MKNNYLNKEIRLKYDKASEKYYAFCISSGDHYILTRTAYLILELIEQGKNTNEITNFIHKKEKIDLDICTTDTKQFINKCIKNGIIINNREVNTNDKKRQN